MKILVVEDDKKLSLIMKDYLENEKYEVILSENYNNAIKILEKNQDISLTILDLMLENKLDGFKICKEFRKESSHPIIMITASGREEDQLRGYSLGIDDYITKPFNYKILLAKIKNFIKRNNGDSNIKFSNIDIDVDKKSILLDGEKIALTPKEYSLLICLYKNKNKIFTREQLLNKIWGYDYYGDVRTIDTHIKSLRKKLKLKNIKTKPKIGYYLEV